MRRIQTFNVIRREGATPTNSSRHRLFVQESRPRDEGSSIPVRPAQVEILSTIGARFGNAAAAICWANLFFR